MQQSRLLLSKNMSSEQSMSSKSSIPLETEGGHRTGNDASEHHIHQFYFVTTLHLSSRDSTSKLQLVFVCFGLGTLLFLIRESIILTI
jgi:hypothetical protein